MTVIDIINVEAKAPFNFDLTAQIFRNGDPEIRSYRDGVFRQAIPLEGRLVLVEVSSAGSVEQPSLTVQLRANEPLTTQDTLKVKDIVKYIFNLDFDLCSFYNEIQGDPVMHSIAQQLYGLKNPTTSTVFESLVNSVIEQQISIKVAIALEDKLIKKFGDCVIIDGKNFFVFPTPQRIASATVDEVQQVGLSRRKAEYIHGGAELIVAGKLDLEQLRKRGRCRGNNSRT